MSVKMRDEIAAQLKALLDGAEVAPLTDDQQIEVGELTAQLKDVSASIKAAAEANAFLAGLSANNNNDSAEVVHDGGASVGAHFVKSVELASIKGVGGATVVAPEYKATVTTAPYAAMLTEVDSHVVPQVRRRLTIADLFGKAATSKQAITYYTEGEATTEPGAVGEGDAVPEFGAANPVAKTESLKAVAGRITMSEDMVDDLKFVSSEIDNRLLYHLALAEENALVNGSGVGTAVEGILTRDIESVVSASVADNPKALYRAISKVETTGLDADAIVIHPADYEALRLETDANGQYYGGGYFGGAYGSDGAALQPLLWGRKTVVTPAVPQGTALVGAFALAASLIRKGGVVVDATNSHANDFAEYKVTVRAKVRLLLAVRRPKAFVKVTLAAADED